MSLNGRKSIVEHFNNKPQTIYNKDECIYWYDYIFECMSKGFGSFGIIPHRVENPFNAPTIYKPLRKKEKATKFVHDIMCEYINNDKIKWIDCDEMLPDNFIDVLVTCIDQRGYSYVAKAKINNLGKWEYEYGVDDSIEVIAWSLFPQPYKKRGEEE